MSRFRWPYALAAALALGPSARAQPGGAAGVRGAAAAVYAAVLANSAGDLPTPLWVDAATVRVEARGLLAAAAGRPTQPPDVPRLLGRLAAASATPTDARRLALPRGARVVDGPRSQRLQEAGRGGTVVYGLSPVAFADDSAQALVYIERRCGPLCGGGELVLLARTEGGRWARRRTVVAWLG